MQLKCRQCGSERIIPQAELADQGQHSDGALRALVGFERPEAVFVRGSVCARFRANICGECGYTELWASNPEALYEAYRRWAQYGG